jgi:NCS1 family nucleobase:cation symporter-1
MVPAVLQAISIIGWNSLLIIFFAKSAVQLCVALGILNLGSHSAVLVPLLTLLACAIIFTALRRGAGGVSLVSNILFAHVFVGLWMLYLLVSHRWPELIAARPVLASPDRLWNYTTGVELGIGATLSWWPYIGAMIRMAPDGRTIVLPVLLGMGAPVPLLSLIGLAGALVLKSSDPAEWLRTVGGPVYAIISLSFVTAANFGTTTAGIYASAIGLRNFAALQRRSWTTLLLITITPVALVGIFIPELFFAKFGNFLALIGVAFAPLCGIQIADYFVLRRRRIDIRAIYADRPGTPYYFWRGINPAALLALAAGCCTYILLLDPLSYRSRGLYAYVTASLPSVTAAALVYFLASLIVIRSGRGGYRGF